MRNCRIILALALLFWITACDKNAEDYPITYESSHLSGYEVKAYTKHGEITAPEIRDRLISKKKFSVNNITTGGYYENIVALYSKSENKVMLTIDDEKEEKPRNVITKDSLIYWEQQKISEYPFNSGYNYNSLNSSKYQPLYSEVIDVPNIFGFDKVAKRKECLYVIKKDDELRFPIYQYSGKLYKDEQCNGIGSGYCGATGYIYSYPANNVFDESCVSALSEKDTIIVQQYYLILKKVNW